MPHSRLRALPSLLLATFSSHSEGTLMLRERQAPKDQHETRGSKAAILLIRAPAS